MRAPFGTTGEEGESIIMTSPIHTRAEAKARAKAIRAELTSQNITISHCAALERVAKEQGFDSWNVLSARLSNEPLIPLQVGSRVSGTYLKQPFVGTVHGLQNLSAGGSFKIAIDFDEPVDVSAFESFSIFRTRIHATISPEHKSYTKTSDGAPHLEIIETSMA